MAKRFGEFISESFVSSLVLSEARGGPDYDYEQSFVNLYNHMVNKTDSKGREMRKMARLAISKGDMFTVIDLLAKEVHKAQVDPDHPLNFDNLKADDAGFTGGKRSKSGEVEDKEAHRQAYYDKLANQQYSFLNFVQSKSGRVQASKGHTAEREGATKVPLTAKAKELTGKEQDTSKVDVSFKDGNGNSIYGISLKDSKGAVVNSSGADETKSYILLGLGNLLDSQEQAGEITPEERAEKESHATELANQLALYMASTKGMSKEEQRDALPQMQAYLDEIEHSVPGTMQAMSAEAITGKGKYGDASTVDALFSTGRGGEVIEDPEWLAQYVFQRGRLGKGQTKPKDGPREQRPTTFTGDIKGYKDAEDKPDTSAWLQKWESEWGQPAWEKKIAGFEPEIQDQISQLQNTGSFGLKDLADFEYADSLAKQSRAETEHAQTAADLESQIGQTAAELQQAIKQQEEDKTVKGKDGKRVLRQHVGTFFNNNQDEKREYDEKQANNATAVQTASDTHTATIDAHQTHINTPPTATLDTIRQGAAQAQAAPEQPVQQEPVQPVQQQPVQQQPVQQQPVQQEPVQQEPVQQQPAPEQPVQQQPVQQKKKKEVPAPTQQAPEQPQN